MLVANNARNPCEFLSYSSILAKSLQKSCQLGCWPDLNACSAPDCHASHRCVYVIYTNITHTPHNTMENNTKLRFSFNCNASASVSVIINEFARYFCIFWPQKNVIRKQRDEPTKLMNLWQTTTETRNII